MKIVKPSAELIWITSDAEKIIEKAGRVCYKSEDNITTNSYEKFIKILINRGHESILEHASASFKFICDRGVSHELVRNRIASFAMESTRFCNYGKDKFDNQITVIEPPYLNDRERLIWIESCEISEKCYLELLKSQTPEIARSVLPTCLKTEVVVTANLREWRHIFKLRKFGTSGVPHPQIKEIMDIAFDLIIKECPVIFEDLKDAS